MSCSSASNLWLPCYRSPFFSKHSNTVLAISHGSGEGVCCLRGHRHHSLWVKPMIQVTPYHVPSHLLSWRSCHAKGENSEGAWSGESIVLDEQTLERDLQIAIEEENYARAAKIRDSLRRLHENSKASVLAANNRFYNSFKKGDMAAMQALWAKGDHVCVVHPGVGGISGYDLVMGSWEFVWADYEFPFEIEVKDAQVHVRGDLGYVTCIEVVKTKGSSWGKQFVTNVFEKVDGQWFICVHHASHIDL